MTPRAESRRLYRDATIHNPAERYWFSCYEDKAKYGIHFDQFEIETTVRLAGVIPSFRLLKPHLTLDNLIKDRR